MIHKYIYMVCIGTAILFSGCNSAQAVAPQSINNDPKWLDDPYIEKDSMAAVGCARAHYNGVPGQKKLAVANAIDEIAAQINTTVENVTLRHKKHSSGIQTSSTQNSTSLHSVDKMSVQTRIKAYHTKNNGEICAWVIQK